MLKINRWFLIFILGMLGAAAPAMGDEDPSQDLSPALSASSGTSEETMAEPAAVEEKTSGEMSSPKPEIPEAVSGDTASEESRPGIDTAVQLAQEEVRDPFATPVEEETPNAKRSVQPAGPTTAADLQGIGFGSKDAYAIFNNEVYYIGDEKNGIKLLEVRRREVDIELNGGKVTVPLFPGEDLRKAKERAQKKGPVKDVPPDPKTEIQESFSGREQPPL